MPLKEVLANAPKPGRLAIAKRNWEIMTSDPWTVQGYSLELIKAPTQLSPPGQMHLLGRQETLMREKIKSLLEKGAIERVRVPHHPQYISQMFFVLKKDGSMRPVFNLKGLNQFLHWEHFKMENVQMIRDLIQEGDWMVKMDLKDAYFALLIRQEDRGG